MKLITFNSVQWADLRQPSELVELSLIEGSEYPGLVQRLFYSLGYTKNAHRSATHVCYTTLVRPLKQKRLRLRGLTTAMVSAKALQERWQ
jgi:hypothetical protein